MWQNLSKGDFLPFKLNLEPYIHILPSMVFYKNLCVLHKDFFDEV